MYVVSVGWVLANKANQGVLHAYVYIITAPQVEVSFKKNVLTVVLTISS